MFEDLCPADNDPAVVEEETTEANKQGENITSVVSSVLRWGSNPSLSRHREHSSIELRNWCLAISIVDFLFLFFQPPFF
jgi:hypothetical protein